MKNLMITYDTIFLYLFLCMDIVHIVVLVVVCTFNRDLSAPILTLETFLRRIICFASNNI